MSDTRTRKSVNTGDTIEVDEPSENHGGLPDDGRAHFLYEYVYQRKIQPQGNLQGKLTEATTKDMLSQKPLPPADEEARKRQGMSSSIIMFSIFLMFQTQCQSMPCKNLSYEIWKVRA